MSNQVAKLFIRGSLMNDTAKNLSEEEKTRVVELMNLAWNDPNLVNPRYEFCMALSRTIGNEYKDLDFGMNEIWITFWRAAVDALFHNPKPQVVSDALIRKKHFQTWMFNYLRQILLENKIPTQKMSRELTGAANDVALEYLKFILDNKNIDYILDSAQNKVMLHLDINMVPLEVLEKIWEIRDEVSGQGAEVEINDSGLVITAAENVNFITKTISEPVRINSVSMSGVDGKDDDRDNFQQHCEHNAREEQEDPMDTMIMDDTLEALNDRLTPTARKVLDMLLNPTKEFLDTYYPNRKREVTPKEIHIAQWLGITKREVVEAMSSIRQQATALDIG
jgi:hypothetical protein